MGIKGFLKTRRVGAVAAHDHVIAGTAAKAIIAGAAADKVIIGTQCHLDGHVLSDQEIHGVGTVSGQDVHREQDAIKHMHDAV